MKKVRVVPRKNYLYLVLMIVCVIFITIITFNVIDKYKNRRLETSYLSGYITEVNVNELTDILIEPDSEMFILLTQTKNEEVHKFETNLKKVIKKNNFRDNFVYIDLTNNEDYLDVVNSTFNSSIKKIPAIIYIKNGEFVKGIDSKDSMLKSGDFEKLLDEYEVE